MSLRPRTVIANKGWAGLSSASRRAPTPNVPTSRDDVRFCCRTIEGGIPKLDAYSLRLNSEVPHMITVNGIRRKYKPPAIDGKSYFGLIFLFGIKNWRTARRHA